MSNKPEPREPISVQDTALRFKTSPQTIYGWIKKGKLSTVTKPGYDIGLRVTLESIEALEKGSAS